MIAIIITIVIGSTRNNNNNSNSNTDNYNTNNNSNSNRNSNNNSNSNTCSFQIYYFLRCAFSAPPPRGKKLSCFTGIQPLNFLIRNVLIKEPGVAFFVKFMASPMNQMF